MVINDHGIQLRGELEYPHCRNGYVPLMVLIHGVTGHRKEPHLAALRNAALCEGIAVLIADLYGHGESDGSFENHDLNQWVSNIETLINYGKAQKFISKIFLAGHSQGGLAVLLAAIRRSEDIDGLILLSPALTIPDHIREGMFLGISFDPDNLPENMEFTTDMTYRLKRNYFTVARKIWPKHTAEQYMGPVLFIHGSEDEVVPYSEAVEMAHWFPSCDFITLKDETHCYDYNVKAMTDSVTAWIKKNEE